MFIFAENRGVQTLAMTYPVSSRYYCTDSDESGVFF